MPTYEYRCTNEHTFEQFQKISDPPVESCPQCGAPAERVLSGGAGLLFKGTGFYITDYRSDTYKKAAESDKKASGSGSGSETGSGSGAKKSSGGGSSTSSGGSTAT